MGLKHRWKIDSTYDRLLSTESRDAVFPTAGAWSIALIFPSTYAVGISNLGFQTVHRLIGTTEGFGVERFFFPVGDGIPHPPPFYSFETRRPLGDFDVLAFSFSFEGDFDRLPGILGPLGVPCVAAKRSRRHPILLAGGAGVGANPRALARVFDILVPGEAETTLPGILQNLKTFGRDLSKWLPAPGVWLPAFLAEMPGPPPPHDISLEPAYSHIQSGENTFGGSFLIEIMRGCPRSCAFCFARVHYQPVRIVAPESLLGIIDGRSNLTDIGLIAPSLFDHPGLLDILNGLIERKIRIRNSSVKWERLSDEVLSALAISGTKSLTLAPETGSPAMAERMGKVLPLDRFYATIDRIKSFGFTHLKLYFLVGTPGETLEELDATIEMISRIGKMTVGRSFALTAAFSGFVVKARTPWASAVGVSRDELRKRFRYLRSGCRGVADAVKLVFDSPNEVIRQQYLSRVGPEFADELEREAQSCKDSPISIGNSFGVGDC